MKTFTFWEENLIEKVFSLTQDQVKERFNNWLFKQELNSLSFFGTRNIGQFVTGADGLRSVAERQTMIDLEYLLRGPMWSFIEDIEMLVPLLGEQAKLKPEKISLWGIAILKCINEKRDMISLISQLCSQYKDNPEMMTQMLGFPAAKILARLIGAVPPKLAKKNFGQALKKLNNEK